MNPIMLFEATPIGTAFASIQTDALAAIAEVAPIGLAVFGAFLVWRLGKKFFSSIAK